MSKRIVIRKLNKIIDVFSGEEGWESDHWTRFVLIGNYLKFIKGVQLSPHDFNHVKKELGL